MKLSRRRGDALRQAIFDAVFDQLGSVGYPRLTMGAVAAAAGTGKAALYRRWCTKEELVADALRHGLPSPHAVPAQDTLRADLLALLRCLRDALACTHGAAVEDGRVHAVVRELAVEPTQALILEALRRAVGRGEIAPESVTPTAAAVGPAMVLHHLLTRGADATDQDLAELVDGVLLRMA